MVNKTIGHVTHRPLCFSALPAGIENSRQTATGGTAAATFMFRIRPTSKSDLVITLFVRIRGESTGKAGTMMVSRGNVSIAARTVRQIAFCASAPRRRRNHAETNPIIANNSARTTDSDKNARPCISHLLFFPPPFDCFRKLPQLGAVDYFVVNHARDQRPRGAIPEFINDLPDCPDSEFVGPNRRVDVGAALFRV